MCTWAGYVGTEAAAPILLAMGKRQEGLWSGFYSGVVTLSEAHLCLAKVVGTMAQLEAETDVQGFPGTIGLVHSRTNSGGGRAWGQPFLSSGRTVACCAQGSVGQFDGTARVHLGNELLSSGRALPTATPGPVGDYPVLQDGTAVHSTEMAGEAVELERERGAEPVEAVRRVMLRMPTEAIYAFIFHDQPDSIVVANVNRRMAIGRDVSGTYIATSAVAFPDGVHWRLETPGNSIAVIERGSVHFEPIAPPGTFDVQEVMPANLDSAFLDFVRENPGCGLPHAIGQALAPLFAERGLSRRAAAGFQTMERLLTAGLIRTETGTVPGVDGRGLAPRTVFFGGDAASQDLLPRAD